MVLHPQQRKKAITWKKKPRNPHVVIVSFSQGYSNSRSVINKTTLLHATKHGSIHSMKNKTITQGLIKTQHKVLEGPLFTKG